MNVKEYKYSITDVPEEQYFYTNDGRIIKNLLELAEAFKQMKKEVFESHVNREKNDFSKWVRDSVKDEALAGKMARIIMKDKTEILVLRKILEISEEVGEK